MTARTQTLVLGGGLSGAVAALLRARAGDAVTVAAGAPGGSAHWSGALDLFGPCLRDPSGGLITDPAARLQHLLLRRPHHPYGALGLVTPRALAQAAGEAAAALGGLLDLSTRGWAMTSLGWPRWCDGASPCVGVWAADPGLVGVVGFLNVAGFDAPMAAAALGAHGVRARAFSAHAPWGAPAGAPPADAIDTARRLDTTPADRAADGWREVAAALRAAAGDDPPARWLLPPSLGLGFARAQAHRHALSDLLGAPVGEAAGAHDSAHGWRLHGALADALRGEGVALLQGKRALRAQPDAAGVTVTWSDGTQTVAERLILATGRWLSGGLPRRGPWREPLTGAPLWLDGASMADTPDHPPRLLSPTFSADHPLLRAGLAVSPAGLLLGGDGAPLHPRLYAVGAALGGAALTDACAAGVALGAAVVAAR